MARQSEDSVPASERTDELPALSAEAIRRFELTGRSDNAVMTQDLDESLEKLRDALDQAEERWLRLENRIGEQDGAIARLRTELQQRSMQSRGEPQLLAGVPELTEVVAAPLPAAAPASVPAGTGKSPSAPPGPDSGSSAISQAEQALLERIACLEAYIAGRSDHWHEMEAEVEARGRRIAELELELEQRIVREQTLTERLQAAGDRSDGFRDQIRRMHLRIESLEGDEV